MIGAADHVRDPEVDVVDDAARWKVGEPSSGHSITPRTAAAGSARAASDVPLGAVALAHGAFVPADPEPAEIVDDRLLAPRQVACQVGVVDP